MKKYKYILQISLILSLLSCTTEENKSDGYGIFETDEIIVSSQASGVIKFLNVEEGLEITKDKVVGVIDTVQLDLKKEQLLVQKNIIRSKLKNIKAQMDVVKAQKENAELEKERFTRLVSKDAATQKQLDDILSQINVFDKQIISISTQGASINDELRSVDIQIEQLNDQIKKCYIVNPLKGTVLSKYSYTGEITAFSKPLYKISDLKNIYLKVYVPGDQISSVKLGDNAEVLIDSENSTMKKYSGKVSWISEKAEFTPKIIQTKKERINLVYAVKIKVENDGSLKIGMPGEANFKR